MDDSVKYWDKRSELFRTEFEAAAAYDAYVSTGDEREQARWTKYRELIGVPPETQELVRKFSRKLNLLVLSGIWCGDCARQGPMLAALAELSEHLDCRFAENRQRTELQDELRINGAQKVPIVLALSEDFFEVARFGDKHLQNYRVKLKTELGAACDAGLAGESADELKRELGDWSDWIERAHAILRLAPMLRRRYND